MYDFTEIDILLDSKYREYNGFTQSFRYLRWNVSNSSNAKSGSVIIKPGDLLDRKVYGLKIGNFIIPTNRSFAVSNYSTIGIGIDELNSYAFDCDSNKVLILMQSTPLYNNSKILLSNNYGSSECIKIFPNPINNLQSLTLRFYYDGFTEFTFKNDRLIGVTTLSTIVNSVITSTLPIDSAVEVGDALYLYDLISDDPNDFNIINAINSALKLDGFIVSILNVGAYTITTSLDLSSLNGNITAGSIYYLNRRISIPIKLLVK
jgi:hypothetical protein